MRINISLELTEDEMPAARELIAQLQQLTQHVHTSLRQEPTSGLQELTQLIASVDGEHANIDGVAEKVRRVFEATPPAKMEQLLSDFFDAFSNVVFDSELVQEEKSIAPYVYLLSHLPEGPKTKIRDSLIQKILKFLTLKRPIDCGRDEFFAHAEAFAALVKLEFVSVRGAITTINTLLKKEENRCAAITMLGKTVELCLDILHEKCDNATLRELRVTLDGITEPTFTYDIQYIKENMNWGHITYTSSYQGHGNVIFALAYDPAQDLLISAAKDGAVLTWGNTGTLHQTIQLPRHYACSLDYNPHSRTLYMCGVAKDGKDQAHPALIAYRLDDQNKWVHQGTLEKDGVKVISSVKTNLFPNSSNFIAAEVEADIATRSIICLYDSSQAKFNLLRPMSTFEEHVDIITCLAAVQNVDGQFLSGGRDHKVLLWDVRAPRCVGRLPGHDGTVTSISAIGNHVLTGGLDKKLLQFDLRALSGPAVVNNWVLDDSAVLKVALGEAGQEGVASTLHGLHHVIFATGETRRVPLPNQPSDRDVRYHDLIWNRDKTVLFAGGDGMRIDVYSSRASLNPALAF